MQRCTLKFYLLLSRHLFTCSFIKTVNFNWNEIQIQSYENKLNIVTQNCVLSVHGCFNFRWLARHARVISRIPIFLFLILRNRKQYSFGKLHNFVWRVTSVYIHIFILIRRKILHSFCFHTYIRMKHGASSF